MNPRISNKLAHRLTHLQPDQIEQIVVRARALKRRSGSQEGSLDTWIERILKKDERALGKLSPSVKGQVVATTATTAVVESDKGLTTAQLATHAVVVGDFVTCGDSADGSTYVTDVEQRRTRLSRPSVAGDRAEQVIVANIDVVVIVVSVVAPPLHPRLIDRYLVAVQQGGASPAIFVNKIDLLIDPSELTILDSYRNIGIPVALGSATTPGGGESLFKTVQGRTCVFVGHSGVGKSSIVNALKPDASLATRSVSEGYGRGTHTTTASSLHRLADGTVLIDTPGIRSFGLRALESHQIADYFPEFNGHKCRFNDCAHVHEPGCDVKKAVENGNIKEARYEAYLRLKDEIV